MYIWIGCKLPKAFEEKIRTRCLVCNEKIGLNMVAFSLPQHISLKISFSSDRWEAILCDLSAWLGEQKPATICLREMQLQGNVLWLSAAENAWLTGLHAALDDRLKSRFDVPQHPFDREFMFHSTLFLDEDTQKLAAMRDALAEEFAPQELPVDTFLLGISETGKPGSYRVVREITV